MMQRVISAPSEQIQHFINDQAVPVSARFAVARLHEAMSRSSPLLFSASAHNDPRVLLRDLTAAIAWMASSPPPHKQQWALLVPRLKRVRALITHDQAVRRWFPDEVAAFLIAYAVLPGNPKKSDWPTAAAGLTVASRNLRDAMLHPTAGYRSRLTTTVCVAFRGKVIAPQSLRRLDERVGLLAAMLIDEGRDPDEVGVHLVEALKQSPPSRWDKVAREALSGGWKEFQVVVATAGFVPERWHPKAVPDAVPVRFASALRLIREGWSPRITATLLLQARLCAADGLILARTRARDQVHAVRLCRDLAQRAADHHAVTASHRRVRILSPTMVRQRDRSAANYVGRPRPLTAAVPLEHPPVTVAGAMSYLRKAALAESDVDRLLNGWIGIESLGRGRAGVTAQSLVASQLPELAWLLAARATFVHSYERFAEEAADDHDLSVATHYVKPASNDWDLRWLELLARAGPTDVQDALDRALERCTPLTAWRVGEARERLLNGRLLVQQLNRHRLEVEWVIARLREARNTVAHNAMTDVEQVSVSKALGRPHQRPTDARLLGRASMVLLSEVGTVAAQRMTGQPGQVRTFERYLARTASFVTGIEGRAKTAATGTPFQARAPSLP